MHEIQLTNIYTLSTVFTASAVYHPYIFNKLGFLGSFYKEYSESCHNAVRIGSILLRCLGCMDLPEGLPQVISRIQLDLSRTLIKI